MVHYLHGSLMMPVLLSPFYHEQNETEKDYATACLGRTDGQWLSRGLDPGGSASNLPMSPPGNPGVPTTWALVYDAPLFLLTLGH